MKKIIYAVALLLAIGSLPANAQEVAQANRLLNILHTYYDIKNALVAGNSKAASENATAFIKNLNGISLKYLSEQNVHILLKDAGTIADAGSIEKQRLAFANFSDNITAVVKQGKIAKAPVYLQYCPMKKASWLSDEKNIKNPYYGSSMLTCGNITETID